MQNFRGKHPLKSDQNYVVTSNNGFSDYSVRIFGSCLITNSNRSTYRKILPTVQNYSLIFGQDQRAVKRADMAEQVDQGTDRAELVTQTAILDHSPAVGGGILREPIIQQCYKALSG